MRVVDTSAWLEWLSDSPLGRKVGLELPQTEGWIVPTIVQYELARYLAREVSEECGGRYNRIFHSVRCGALGHPAGSPSGGNGARQ
jgi:uncharacterized protein with PIN domain